MAVRRSGLSIGLAVICGVLMACGSCKKAAPLSENQKRLLLFQHIDEFPPVTASCAGGDGSVHGTFGDHKEMTFILVGGPSSATFSRKDNKHVFLHANVVLPGKQPPTTDPTFTWTEDGNSKTIHGFGSQAELTLPGGVQATLVVGPLPDWASLDPTAVRQRTELLRRTIH